MKKYWLIFGIIAVAFVCASQVLAKDYTNEPMVTEPTPDGKDMIVGDNFMQTIQGLPATPENAWVRYHDQQDPWGRPKREGKNWRIINGMDQDVHPYIGDPMNDFRPMTNFAKIEFVWPGMPSKFVKYRAMNNQNPCLRLNTDSTPARSK